MSDVHDERRTAPAVAEWSGIRRRRSQAAKDRTALARQLHQAGLNKADIADVVGVDWSQVDGVLNGTR